MDQWGQIVVMSTQLFSILVKKLKEKGVFTEEDTQDIFVEIFKTFYPDEQERKEAFKQILEEIKAS